MSQNLTPSLIKDINPGAESSDINFIGGVNGNLIFTSSDANFTLNTFSTKVQKTDGSFSGTVIIDEIDASNFSIESTTTSDAAYFLTSTFPRPTTELLYKVDDSGVSLVDSADLLFPSLEDIDNLNNFKDTLFYTKQEGPSFSKLFKIDKEQQQPVLIKENVRFSDGLPNPGGFAAVGDTFFFAANDRSFSFAEGFEQELWKTDGSPEGTALVKNINLTDSSNPDNLTDVNGTLFFTADDGINGRELWKSDGTQTGTVLVKDINSGTASSSINNLTDVNGTAFFTADDGINGTELWKSDGTESGTVLVKDITPGSQGSNADNLINVNGTLFLGVNDGSNGVELWKSDGTVDGTTLVKDINPGGNSSNPDNLTNLDGILYFTASDGSNGVELWKSDGTQSGTVLVGDINSGAASSNPEELTVVDGELYFSADDGVNGRELWGLTEGGSQPNQDLILGGDSDDVLVGNEQDNIIDGLKGNDTLTGGGGKDKFVLSGDFGSDVITDFTLGEDEIINATDNIVLTVASIGDAVNVAFSNTGDVLQVNLNGNDQAGLENYLLSIGSSQTLPY